MFLRDYFDVFRQSTRFNCRRSKQSSFYVLESLKIVKGGIHDKRISEGLF